MNILVGNTGFVGSNLQKSYKFDKLYNSKNIGDAFGLSPDFLVYSGVRAEMFLANNYPDKDLEHIQDAISNIQKINPKTIVLISTIAVFNEPLDVNEDTEISSDLSSPYGKHRLYLENWIRENFNNYLIVRLPAIYGENLKKNFIYDLINVSPGLLTEDKYFELCEKDNFIKDYYVKLDNGYYKCTDSFAVKNYFEQIGFSAINFTDSRSVYQFYNLKNLWDHINFALANNIKIFNISTEPVSAKELYSYLYKKDFYNEVSLNPYKYDMRTKYFSNGYIYNKKEVLEDISSFIFEKSSINNQGILN